MILRVRIVALYVIKAFHNGFFFEGCEHYLRSRRRMRPGQKSKKVLAAIFEADLFWVSVRRGMARVPPKFRLEPSGESCLRAQVPISQGRGRKLYCSSMYILEDHLALSMCSFAIDTWAFSPPFSLRSLFLSHACSLSGFQGEKHRTYLPPKSR